MPIIHISWFAGRSVDLKRELAKVLTHDVCRIARCEPADVQIVFTDVEHVNWAQGGGLLDDRAADK